MIASVIIPVLAHPEITDVGQHLKDMDKVDFLFGSAPCVFMGVFIVLQKSLLS